MSIEDFRKLSLLELLKQPPRKKVFCSWCGGSGIINCRGYRQSDTCNKCYGDKKGKSVIDYKKWGKQIRECIKAEHKD